MRAIVITIAVAAALFTTVAVASAETDVSVGGKAFTAHNFRTLRSYVIVEDAQHDRAQARANRRIAGLTVTVHNLQSQVANLNAEVDQLVQNEQGEGTCVDHDRGKGDDKGGDRDCGDRS